MNLWNREPARILAIAQAGIALAIGFGLSISNEQFALIMVFMSAVFGEATRSQVTSNGKTFQVTSEAAHTGEVPADIAKLSKEAP